LTTVKSATGVKS